MKKIAIGLILLFSSQAFAALEMQTPPRSKMEKRIKKQNKKKKKKGDTTCPKIDC